MNLAQNNNLTVGLLVNSLFSPHSGLDPLDPISTTQRYSTNAYMFTAKDQHLFQNGMLLEAGVATSSFYTSVRAHGRPNLRRQLPTEPAAITTSPITARAGAPRRSATSSCRPSTRRESTSSSWALISIASTIIRNTTGILTWWNAHDGTLSRSVSFTNAPPFTRYDAEASGYAQDRWSITPRWLLEPGVRFDADQIVRGVAASPRLASTFLLKRNGDSKISWGIGVYRDPSNLDILTRSLTGTRTDYFYDATGTNLLQPPVLSTFTINPEPVALLLCHQRQRGL